MVVERTVVPSIEADFGLTSSKFIHASYIVSFSRIVKALAKPYSWAFDRLWRKILARPVVCATCAFLIIFAQS